MTDVRSTANSRVSVPAQSTGEAYIDTAAYAAALEEPQTSIRSHGYEPRGLDSIPESPMFTGRFGRMFRHAEPFIPDLGLIDRLAKEVSEPTTPGTDFDNPDFPAGYTFLGQFIDHDLTFDPVSSFERQNDPDALTDFRTPRFDLDSIYGRGPVDQPYLYDRSENGEKFRIGGHGNVADLPRDDQGVALIGDPRNDENLIVSHIQLTMLKFHNKVVDWLRRPENNVHRRAGEDTFTAAQRLVRWHYQWVALHDFLPRVVDREILDDVVIREPLVPGGMPADRARLTFFSWQNQPFMPVEFSVAAYRFGHSLVRPGYTLNPDVGFKPIFTAESAHKNPHAHLGGFRPFPDGWQIKWPLFFRIGDDAEDPQFGRKMDRFLSPPLLDLPPEQAEGINNLAKRNLLRGARLGLPSGQDTARAMGVAPLTGDGLPDPAPLWYYILREAEKTGKLGPVGGRIVAEVFAGLLSDDPASYLSTEPGWTPVLGAGPKGRFTMSDLIAFTGFAV